MDGFVDLFWGAFGDDVMDTFRYIFGTFFRMVLGMLFGKLLVTIFGMLLWTPIRTLSGHFF